MNVRCAVSSCPNTLKNTGSRVKYHRFPADEGLRSVWTVRCDRRDSWNPLTSFVCSAHFTDDDYVKLPQSPLAKKLYPDAVPSKNLKLFGWDMDETPGTGTGTDFSDAEDPFIRSMIKTSSRRRADKSPRSSNRRNVLRRGDTSQSETELSGAEGSSFRGNQNNVGRPTAGPPKKKRRQKDTYCAVLTCRAKRSRGFHYFPKDRKMRQKWCNIIYHGEPHHFASNPHSRKSKIICRRHFTEDDYNDPPSSGGARRLMYGVVPSVNIPICRAEVRLARLKLHLDLNRRRPEERHLSFQERLAREPELYELYQEYLEEVKHIDPSRLHVLPVLPANGELVGAGEPAPGDPSFVPKKERLLRERQEKKAAKILSREERRKMERERRQEYLKRKKELRALLKSDPQAYEKLLVEEETEEKNLRKEKGIAYRIIKKVNKGEEVKFGDKVAIVAEDPDNGAKYKVIVKKIVHKSKGSAIPFDEGPSKVVINPAEGAELFKKVISKLDGSSAKRIKFATADKITKMGLQQKPKQPQKEFLVVTSTDEGVYIAVPADEAPGDPEDGEPTDLVGQDSSAVEVPSSAVEVESSALHEIEQGEVYEDECHDDNYDDDDHRRSDAEMETEDFSMTDEVGGPDHCYTNKTVVEQVETSAADPFEELQEQLRSMPEEEARMFVKEKMDGYKTVFKQQVTKLRQLLRARQKTDRKVKCLTRILCSTLRDQITKYYLQ